MPSTRMRFAMLLPLLSLAAAVVLVAVPISLTFLNLEAFSQHSDKAVISAGNFRTEIPRSEFWRKAVMWGTVKSAHTITAIDMPGIIATIPGQPASLPFGAWRALIMPFSSLPFWWFAGLGFDALLRRIRLHWSIFLLGTLLMAGCLILLLGLRFGLPVSDRTDLTWAIYGMALWSVLFSTFPSAWLWLRRA